jgi:hypothetical protein
MPATRSSKIGHATGGTIVEAAVYDTDGRLRIGRAGEEAFTD